MIIDHVVISYDFDSVEQMMEIIDDVIKHGTAEKLNNKNRTTFLKDGYRVSVNKQFRDEKGNVLFKINWVITAFDTKRKEKEKKRSTRESNAKWIEIFGGKRSTPPRGTVTTPPSNPEAGGVTLPPSGVSSGDKGSNNI